MAPISRSAEALVTIAYPVMDILLLGAATRLWFSFDAGHNTSLRLVVITLAGVLVSDTAYAYLALHGTWQDGTIWELGWFLFYLGFGAAALHPSVAVTGGRDLTRAGDQPLAVRRPPRPDGASCRCRCWSVRSRSRTPRAASSSSSAALIMFGLVLLRLNDLVLQLRETLRRERVIRDANGALAAAADIDSIRTTVVHAAAELHPGSRSFLVELRRQGTTGVVVQTVPPDGAFGLRQDTLLQLDDVAGSHVLLYGDIGDPPRSGAQRPDVRDGQCPDRH